MTLMPLMLALPQSERLRYCAELRESAPDMADFLCLIPHFFDALNPPDPKRSDREELTSLVKAAIPEARWILAGARPARSVSALAALNGVEIHADVADLGGFMAQAWVAIAPMASGSGVPMKVLEAWSAGLPVVAHPWTVAGLDDSSWSAVRQAESAEEWAGALIELLGDRKERDTLAALGLEAWNRGYHPEVIAERIREAVETAVLPKRQPT